LGCLYCGKDISTLRLMRDEDFCSDKHRSLHNQRLRNALLSLALPDPEPAAEAAFRLNLPPVECTHAVSTAAEFHTTAYQPYRPSARRLHIDPIIGTEFSPVLSATPAIPQSIASTPVWDARLAPMDIERRVPDSLIVTSLRFSLHTGAPVDTILARGVAVERANLGFSNAPCALAVSAEASPSEEAVRDEGWQPPVQAVIMPALPLELADEGATADEVAAEEPRRAWSAAGAPWSPMELEPIAAGPSSLSMSDPITAAVTEVLPGALEPDFAVALAGAPALPIEYHQAGANRALVADFNLLHTGDTVYPSLRFGIASQASLAMTGGFAAGAKRPAALLSSPVEAPGIAVADLRTELPGFAMPAPARPAPGAAGAFLASPARPVCLSPLPASSFTAAAPQSAMNLCSVAISKPSPAPASVTVFAANGVRPIAIPTALAHPSAGSTSTVEPATLLPAFELLALPEAALQPVDEFLQEEAQPAETEPVLTQAPAEPAQAETRLPQPDLQLSQPPVAEMADVMPSEIEMKPKLSAPSGAPANVQPHSARLPFLPTGFGDSQAGPLPHVRLIAAIQPLAGRPAAPVAEFCPVLTRVGPSAPEPDLTSLGAGWLKLASGADLAFAPLAEAGSAVSVPWIDEGHSPAVPLPPLAPVLGDAAAFTEAPSAPAGFAAGGVTVFQPEMAQPRAGMEELGWLATLGPTVPEVPQQAAANLAPQMAGVVSPELHVQPGRPPLSRREEWNNPRIAVVLPKVMFGASLVPLEQLVRKSEVTEITPKPAAKTVRYNRSNMAFWGKGIAAGIAIGAFISVGTMALRAPRAPAESGPAVALNMPPDKPGSGVFQRVRQAIASRATLEIANDFRSGKQFWDGGKTDWGKGWSRNPDGYVKTGGLSLFRPSLKLTDYRLEFMAQIENKAMGWVFRAQDTGNFYAMKFNVVEPGLRPIISVVRYPVVNGKRGHRVEIPLQVMMHNNTPYRVAVDVRGNHFTTSIEGEQVDSFFDDTLQAGGVGFFSESAERARLYWMKITNNDDFLGHICAYLAGSRPGSLGGDGEQRAFVNTDTWRDCPGRPLPVDMPVVALITRRPRFGAPAAAVSAVEKCGLAG